MKRKWIISLAPVIFLAMAAVLFLGYQRTRPDNPTSSLKAVYYCPMHHSYTSDHPGDCPICGMKLVKKEISSSQDDECMVSKVAQEEAKSPGEFCIEHKCSMKDCPMTVKGHIKPGERLFCPICGEVIAAEGGKVVGSAGDVSGAGSSGNGKKVLYYRNPMDPRVTSPRPMKDPMGMDYIPVYEEPGMDKGAIKLSQDQRQMIGVTTSSIEVRELSRVQRASGRIAYDPQLAVAQEEFIQALIAGEKAEISGFAEVAERARRLTEASRNKLRLLGMNDQQISYLEKKRKAETNLYLPGEGEKVWAYVSVYEYEIAYIHPGDSVDIEAAAYPGEMFSGKVVSVDPVIDKETRTNQVRVEVANPGNKLKPEMFVTAVIREHIGKKPAVPASAVLDTGLRKIVYVSKPGGFLESREVVLGQKAGDYYVLVSGLDPEEVVVTSGNFLVDSEAKLNGTGREH